MLRMALPPQYDFCSFIKLTTRTHRLYTIIYVYRSTHGSNLEVFELQLFNSVRDFHIITVRI